MLGARVGIVDRIVVVGSNFQNGVVVVVVGVGVVDWDSIVVGAVVVKWCCGGPLW